MILTLQILIATVLVIVALWETFQLARHRDDLPLRALAPGLVCLALAASAGIPTPALQPLAHLLGSGYSDIINGCWMTMAYCFAVFFVLADTTTSAAARTRTASRELVFLLLAVAVMVTVHQTAPAGTWHHPQRVSDYKTWQNTVYVVSVEGYALACWVIGVRRATRYLRRLQHTLARVAFRLVITGTGALAIGVDGSALVITALHGLLSDSPPRFPILDTAYLVALLAGQGVLAAGLLLAPVASAAPTARTRMDRWLRRRYSRQLEPLWRTLADEFPFLVLQPDGHDQQTTVPREGRDFERTVNEITDGLAHLAPHYAATAKDGEREPRRAALFVWAALEVRADNRRLRWAGGGIEESPPPFPRLEPDFDGWRRRARWMIGLSRELERLGAVRDRKGDHELLAVG